MQLPRDVSVAPSMVRATTVVRLTESVNCLVVAANQSRRENLAFAAREGGWDVTLCSDVATANSQARQRLLHMAIVDLTATGTQDAASMRFLVEQLACTSRMLLLLCGNLDDAQEEVWARHLGAWMYLPGAIDGTDLVGLCVAARETVDRLTANDRQKSTTTRKRQNYRSS